MGRCEGSKFGDMHRPETQTKLDVLDATEGGHSLFVCIQSSKDSSAIDIKNLQYKRRCKS